MKNKIVFVVLFFFLTVLILVGAICLSRQTEPQKSDDVPDGAASVADHRGAMSEDENGVLVYDDLADYRVKSAKNTVLSTDYEILSAAAPTETSVEKDDRYPNLTVDWALYYDMSIVGTTPVIRYGLSELDSVNYIDKDGTVIKGASPRELTASNGGDVSNNGGYGTNEKGETTVYYEEKCFLFYIINHSCSERIGTEDDVSILSDYIEEGYLVVTLDYKNAPEATSPYIEQSILSAQPLFNRTVAGNVVSDLTDQYGEPIVTTDTYFYFIPEGCRLERDIWFYDASIWAIDGVMESYMDVWNTYYAGTKYDTCQIGKVSSVKELTEKVTKQDGVTPLEYKRTMSIIYPSQPKDNYKVPLFLQEGTGYIREGSSTNAVATSTGFALNGYATAQYDHALYPFIAHYQYNPVATGSAPGGGYGTRSDIYNNARAALRCVRYYADALDYNGELVGIAGISKATNGAALLTSIGNRDYQEALPGYDVNCNAGDVFAQGTERSPENRLQAVVQPFMTYENSDKEISTDTTCSYVSAGAGVNRLFEMDFKNYKKVPTMTAEGLRDPFSCYNYFERLEAAYEENNKENFILIPQLDQGHTYVVGYDDYYGFERFVAMLTFFDIYLKPEAARAPEVVWITPTSGRVNVPVSGKWTVGPFTPYGWEMDTYERNQQIQVKFFETVNPESVGEGMVITDADGNRIDGEWVSSQNDTMFTFVTSGLRAGTTYTMTATDKVLSKNGTPLEKERSVTFTTEGTQAIHAVVDN